MADMSRNIEEQDQERRANQVEWALGLLSSLIVLTILVFLLYEGMSDSGAPPELRVEVDRSVDFDESGHVRFAVFNSGDRPASHVVVSALELDEDGAVMKQQTVVVDYVPARSNKTGGLYVDPQAERVDFRIDGYVDP